jgi:para-nitrobenzyl esterase
LTIAPDLVDTASGLLRGTPLPDGGVLFAGIPFAAPLTGSLRLRSPPRHHPRPETARSW